MKTYIYKAIDSSLERGYNRTIEVYRIKNNTPIYIGYDDKISTASYVGDYGIACKIISKNEGLKMKGSYKLQSKNVRVLNVWFNNPGILYSVIRCLIVMGNT